MFQTTNQLTIYNRRVTYAGLAWNPTIFVGFSNGMWRVFFEEGVEAETWQTSPVQSSPHHPHGQMSACLLFIYWTKGKILIRCGCSLKSLNIAGPDPPRKWQKSEKNSAVQSPKSWTKVQGVQGPRSVQVAQGGAMPPVRKASFKHMMTHCTTVVNSQTSTWRQLHTFGWEDGKMGVELVMCHASYWGENQNFTDKCQTWYMSYYGGKPWWQGVQFAETTPEGEEFSSVHMGWTSSGDYNVAIWTDAMFSLLGYGSTPMESPECSHQKSCYS